jgi:hypothetical protein
MAVLFGHLQGTQGTPSQLPTEHELPENQRLRLELARLQVLLNNLGPASPAAATTIATFTVPTTTAKWIERSSGRPSTDTEIAKAEKDLRAALLAFNTELLVDLAKASREFELAYELGRSLRVTVNPPVNADNQENALTAQLDRGRVAKLQEWLLMLAPNLPGISSTVVSTSLGRWSDFSTTVFDDKSPGSLRGGETPQSVADNMLKALLPQGDVWLDLLSGATTTDGLLTPEAYVAAGEAALGRTARIVKRIALHYWYALSAVGAAVGGAMWLATAYLGGAGKVWTQIAAIAAGLGVSGKGIVSAVVRLSRAAEQPIFALEERDAMAWMITTLPRVNLDNQGVRALRRSGIARSSPLGRA